MEVDGFEAGAEGGVIEVMTGKACVECFFVDEEKSFAEGVGHVDRGGVVVDTLFAPVVSKHGHVEVPGLDLGCSRIHYGEGGG